MNFDLPPSAEPDLTTRTAAAEEKDSEITVISKKPPQQFCTGGFDWRKVGELLIGRQLGSFRLDALLGVGGMGAVFQATDLQLNRQVAVKVLNSTENDPEAERRFRIEAQSTARLDHQNIARVFHVGQDQGWNYIVLELVQGQTLRQLVATQGPLSLKLAVHIFRQLAQALDHAHQRNIIHRDIKPSNVLVADDHSIKIVDMGLARIQRSVDSADHDAEEGMTLGTFDYIAPEQARDARQADQQSDLYSLGCTLYFALVGRPPFADGTTIEKILSHSNAPRPSVLESRPDLPLSMERLVQHLMAPRREDRIGTARELEQRLLDLKWEQDRVRRTAPNLPGRDASVRRVPLMFAGMTLALIVATSIGDFFRRDSQVRLPEWPPAPVLAIATTEQDALATPSSDSIINADQTNPSESAPAEVRSGAVVLPAISEEQIPKALPEKGVFPRPAADVPFQFRTPDLFRPFLTGDGDGMPNPIEWWRRPVVPTSDATDLIRGAGLSGQPIDSANSSLAASEPLLQPREQITTIQVIPGEFAEIATALGNDANKPLPANVARVPSFAQAMESLQQFPNVRRIELNFSGVHRVTTRVLLPSSLREIRGTGGQQPILYFGENVLSESGGKRTCVQMESGNLEIVGVAFAWESAGVKNAALFEIPEISRVTFKECSFQHVEASEPVAAPAFAADASLVAEGSRATLARDGARDSSQEIVRDDRPIVGERGGSDLEIPAWICVVPAILPFSDGQKQGIVTLSQCSLHGPVSGVELRGRQSLLLRWTDSFVSTLGHAILIGDNGVASGNHRFEIELERNSIFARRGILAFEILRPQLAAEVSLFAQDCLMVATDQGIGLLHHQMVADPGTVLRLDRDPPQRLTDAWQTFAESSLFFDGFNNVLVASVLWTLSGEDGRLRASADATQIRSAKWFQQDSARYRTVNPGAATGLARLMQEPASNLIWTGLYDAIGQTATEHGVSIAKLPKFPILAAPPANPRP